MPFHQIHEAKGTITHQCAVCGETRELVIDPAVGDITVHEDCLTVGPCPCCARTPDPWTGQTQQVYEAFRRDIPAWEVGECPHPGSLQGQEYMLDQHLTSVVIEHTQGYTLHPEVVARKHLIRALQRHPHMATHAPLRDPADRRNPADLVKSAHASATPGDGQREEPRS